MQVFLKSLVGSLVVLLIQFASNSKNFFLAGLIPLFPVFSTISYYIVASERATVDLRQTILFGMLSLVPYFVYLGSLYYLVGKYKIMPSLAGATACWVAVALVLVVCWQQPKGNVANASAQNYSQEDSRKRHLDLETEIPQELAKLFAK